MGLPLHGGKGSAECCEPAQFFSPPCPMAIAQVTRQLAAADPDNYGWGPLGLCLESWREESGIELGWACDF